jgi:FMN phosphatase YigB (HAD superfamily)
VTTAPLAVSAITLDFGNTLVRVDRQAARSVVAETAASLARTSIVDDEADFVAAWAEERDRQFREEVPRFREVDVAVRAARVLARGRGMAPPAPDAIWDDAAAAARSTADEIEAVVATYGRAFVERMAPVADATRTIRRLADSGFSLGILSNWPLAITIDRFAAAQGWLPYLQAVVVSQRVGTIKPHPTIFRAAEDALSMPGAGSRILHVGDDWAADVVGARRAGWRAGYLRDQQADTPLPTSERGAAASADPDVQPDVEIDALAELPECVALAGPT